MKRIILISFLALFSYALQSQDANAIPEKSQPGFFAGISYSYLSIESELNDLEYHSVWYGQDLGTVNVDQGELDMINEQRTELYDRHYLAVEPGMVFLNNNRWCFEGSVLFGVSRVKFKTEIDQPEATQKTVTTDFKNLVTGISLNLRYNFSEKWGLSMMPQLIYTWGDSDDIKDNIRPQVDFFVNDLKESYSNGYGRLNIMASYMAGKLMVSLGPGFYYSFINKTYTIDRINPETMDKYHDEIESSLNSIAFIDACLRVDWTIIQPLTLSMESAAGQDLFIKTFLRYNF